MAIARSKTKKDYNTILLEELKLDFKVFGEGLDAVREDVSVLKKDMSTVKDDIVEIKGELHLIRAELKEKVGRDEFRLLEQRVMRLEKAAR